METRTKRKRSENWETDEKLLLQKLIAEYIEIVEDKRTDSHNSQRKREAWAHILRRFNAVNKRKRGLNQLHFQWRNTKFRLKTKGFNLQYRLCSAGDCSKTAPAKAQAAETIIPKEEFEATEYDACENDFQDERVRVGDTSLEEISCSNNLPVKNEPIAAYSDREVKSKDDIYKNQLFVLNKKLKEKELQYMREVHEAQITSIEMERELKLRCMQEEHNVKMKILNGNSYLLK